jgi:hypothetical protein
MPRTQKGGKMIKAWTRRIFLTKTARATAGAFISTCEYHRIDDGTDRRDNLGPGGSTEM